MNTELIGGKTIYLSYTSTAYNLVHDKFHFKTWRSSFRILRFPPDSHDGKEAVHILETYHGMIYFQHVKRIRLTLELFN